MPSYRATIRYGAAAQHYHVQDVSADSLHDALRRLADAYPREVAETADLLELRRQTAPDEREYTEE